MSRKSAIEQMYYGERGNLNNIPSSPEYAHLLDEFSANDRKMREKLKNLPEILALYQKTEKSMNAITSKDAYDYFAEGFRFGLLLGIDVAQ